MKRVLFLFFAFFICFNTTKAQDVALFREAANAALKAYDVPGFSVGIIKNGKIIMSEGFGTRTYGKNEKVDGNTLFAIASNTKAFTATALAKLHAEEKLNLSDPVRKHLPYYEVYDEYVSNHMMVRDLLCHRSGLGTFSGDAIWFKSEQSAKEMLKKIKHLPQAYEWRGGYGYSNVSVIAGGEIIKAVTGKTWAEYVKENFLSPLKMERTQTSVTPLKNIKNVATPHITRNNNEAIPYANWDNMGAAGGIISSSNDMLKWIQTQIDGGTYQDKEIFPTAAQRQTWRPHNVVGSSKTFTSAGLGWFLTHWDGHRIISHGGGYDGMYSQVKIAPDDSLGVVILTNSMTGLSGNLTNFIINTYLGRDTESWLEKAIKNQKKGNNRWVERREGREKSRILDTKPSVSMENYAGTYSDPLFGDIEIILDDEQLKLDFKTSPALNATLSHWHYDTWKINWNESHAWFDFGTVQFVLDNQRIVKKIEFDVPNDDIFFYEIEAIRER